MNEYQVPFLQLLVVLLAYVLHRSVVSRKTLLVERDVTLDVNHQLKLRVDTLTADLNLARERLVQAWKDGYTVPAAPVEEEQHASEAPVFSAAQEQWLEQWEDQETRERWRQYLLRRHRQGRTMDAALADAELELIGGQERLLTPQPTSGMVIG